MGCSDSKEKQVPNDRAAPTPNSTNSAGPVVPPIAGTDRRVIGATAQSILDNSIQFRNLVETIQPLGQHRDAQQLMSDTREVGEYFRGRQVPHQIAGATDSSFFQMINTMKILCQTECTRALTDNLAKQGTYLDEAQSAKYGKQVAAEASKAIGQMTEQYVNSVFERNRMEGSTANAANPAGVPLTRGLPATDASGRGVTPPRKSPRMSPSNMGGAGESEAPVVLPAGKWIRAEGSPFYWSDEEKLFFHPDSGQFFDPETNKWYDPETDEWYDDDNSN